jgi:hypothetical protein
MSDACRNCGHLLTGAYCSSCGQAEREGHPPGVGHFMHDLVHEFAHVDGQIFGALKALFFQPGKLTAEYWAGRVVSWVRPLRIFLVVIALHLLISSGVGPLNFQVELARNAAGDLSVKIAPKGAVGALPRDYKDVSDEEREKFFHVFEKAYAEIRYSSVLVFAFASWLLYRRQQPYFVNHLIAGLHFYSFWYAIALLVSIPAHWAPFWNNLTILSVVYLYLALRRLFHEAWYWRVLKTMTLFVFLLATEMGLGLAAFMWTRSHLG